MVDYFNYFIQDWSQWLALILTLIGLYFNIYKSKISFIVWTLSNIFWVYIGYKTRVYPQCIAFIILSLSNIIGYIKWRNDERRS